MTLLIVVLIIASLMGAFINKVFGVDFDTSVWISLAMMAGAMIVYICWCFFSHRGKVIERAQNIAKIRDRRIEEEHLRNMMFLNDEYYDKYDREMDRKIDLEYDPIYQIERESWDKDHTDDYYFSFSEGRFVREVDRYGSPYVNSDNDMVIPTKGERY